MKGQGVKEQVTGILGKRIGPLVRKIRKEKGLTIKDLAYLSELSQDYLYRIERGNQVPSLVNLGCICVALGIDITTFLIMAQGENRS